MDRRAVIILVVLIVALIALNRPKSRLFEPSNLFKKAAVAPSVKATPKEKAEFSEIELSISEPPNKATVKSGSVRIRGKTAAHAEIFINDAETKADANGNFEAAINLDEGENILIVVANNAFGLAAERELTINYEPK